MSLVWTDRSPRAQRGPGEAGLQSTEGRAGWASKVAGGGEVRSTAKALSRELPYWERWPVLGREDAG